MGLLRQGDRFAKKTVLKKVGLRLSYLSYLESTAAGSAPRSARWCVVSAKNLASMSGGNPLEEQLNHFRSIQKEIGKVQNQMSTAGTQILENEMVLKVYGATNLCREEGEAGHTDAKRRPHPFLFSRLPPAAPFSPAGAGGARGGRAGVQAHRPGECQFCATLMFCAMCPRNLWHRLAEPDPASPLAHPCFYRCL